MKDEDGVRHCALYINATLLRGKMKIGRSKSTGLSWAHVSGSSVKKKKLRCRQIRQDLWGEIKNRRETSTEGPAQKTKQGKSTWRFTRRPIIATQVNNDDVKESAEAPVAGLGYGKPRKKRGISIRGIPRG